MATYTDRVVHDEREARTPLRIWSLLPGVTNAVAVSGTSPALRCAWSITLLTTAVEDGREDVADLEWSQ